MQIVEADIMGAGWNKGSFSYLLGQIMELAYCILFTYFSLTCKTAKSHGFGPIFVVSCSYVFSTPAAFALWMLEVSTSSNYVYTPSLSCVLWTEIRNFLRHSDSRLAQYSPS